GAQAQNLRKASLRKRGRKRAAENHATFTERNCEWRESERRHDNAGRFQRAGETSRPGGINEFHSHGFPRNRAKDQASAHTHGFAARETVAAKKRDRAWARRDLAGGEFSRIAQRNRRAEKARAGTKRSRAPDCAD